MIFYEWHNADELMPEYAVDPPIVKKGGISQIQNLLLNYDVKASDERTVSYQVCDIRIDSGKGWRWMIDCGCDNDLQKLTHWLAYLPAPN